MNTIAFIADLNILITRINLTTDMFLQDQLVDEVLQTIEENLEYGKKYLFRKEEGGEHTGELLAVDVSPTEGVKFLVDVNGETQEFDYCVGVV